jgi:ribosomal protein L37E
MTEQAVTERFCIDCKKKLSKRAKDYDGRCRRCDFLSHLVPYSDAAAAAYCASRRRAGAWHERVLTDLRKHMHAPNFDRWYAPAGEWHTLDVHDFATRSWRV